MIEKLQDEQTKKIKEQNWERKVVYFLIDFVPFMPHSG